MLITVEGVYRHGRIELAEHPEGTSDETRVIVTFIPSHLIDLREHGIDAEQAAELLARLATFAEDWSSPEMDVYDDYDAAQMELARKVM